MTSKRSVVVAVAVAVGVLASVLSYVFLNNAQNNAYHNAKLVPAYVITKAIPRTTTGADVANGGYIVQKKMPAEFRPSSAVTNLSAIRNQEAGANLPVGEVVVSGMFQSPTPSPAWRPRPCPRATSPSRCRWTRSTAWPG